ncbi:MAG: type I-E CRISPR-associated protein Cas5/CasD [Polyangiaceae bacterium]|nr:type I-E CRISPR-associated protein Cas5/CasD [Polyangiaceae bacterium]
MTSVLIRLEGPLQSWGTRSRFPDRDTERDPSKSGVLGLVAAALGMPRDDDGRLARIANCTMGTRVDAEGRQTVDYHTAGAGTFRGQPHRVFGTDDPVITSRSYLTDASFLVALGYPDASLAEEIDQALRHPVWPLFLGRRACAPSLPVAAGIVDSDPESALRAAEWPATHPPENPVRLVLECEPGVGTPRHDHPLSFRLHSRRHARRYVRDAWIEPANLILPAGDTHSLSIVSLKSGRGKGRESNLPDLTG